MKLLKKEGVGLEEVLEEGEIAQEFKDGKEYIVKYFDNEKFQALLKYLNQDHPNLEEKKKAYKYPQIAADILSSQTNQIISFFSTINKDNKLGNFYKLFSEFLDISDNVKTTQINYTRAGYLYKILNSLIIAKPEIFAREIYTQPLLLKCFLNHAYSKSLSTLLLSLLVQVQKTDLSQESEVYKKWLVESKPKRLQIFEEIIKSILSTSDKIEFQSLNDNLCGTLLSILSSPFPEKDEFIDIFFQNYFEKITKNFIELYFLTQNNKIGNILLFVLMTIFETKLNDENYQKKMISTSLDIFELFIKTSDKSFLHFKDVTTFSKEIPKTNTKLLKLTEILNCYIDYFLKIEKSEEIEKSKIEQTIFELFQQHPFNNILHNQLTKILQTIVESKNQKLINIFFFTNSAFLKILNQVVEEYKLINEDHTHQTCCYFGFMKNLHNSLEPYQTEEIKIEPIWDHFNNEFVKNENQKETSIFKEIDQNENVENFEVDFDFSNEQLHQKYAEFLSLNAGTVEESQGGSFENIDIMEQEEEQKQPIENKEEIDSNELREELTIVMNQEETTFHDLKYWKTNFYYDVDSLMKELNISQQFCF